MSSWKCIQSDAAGISNVVAVASFHYSDLKTILGQREPTDWNGNEIVQTKKGVILKRKKTLKSTGIYSEERTVIF